MAKVTIDDRVFQRQMKEYGNNIEDLRDVFEKVGDIAINEFVSNYPASGAKIGVRWASLAPSTIAQKARLGFGGKPMLERTGKLRNAYKITNIKPHSVTIANPTSYAHYHNEGTKKMPMRKIVGLPLKLKGKIAPMILKHIFTKGI